MRNNFGKKSLAILTSMVLGLGFFGGTNAFAAAAAPHKAALFEFNGGSAKLQRLELTVAPLQAVHDNPVALTVRVHVENTGEGDTTAGIITTFLDPQAYVSRETLQNDFPQNAAVLGTKTVPALKSGEKFNTEVTLSEQQIQQIFGGNKKLHNGIYRVQAVFNSNTAAVTDTTGNGNDPSQKPLRAWQPQPLGDELLTAGSVAAAVNKQLSGSGAGQVPGAVVAYGAALQKPFAAATSFVISDSANPLPKHKVVTIVPLTLPAELETLPAAAELETLFTPGTPLVQLLDFAFAQGATVAIDPRIIIAIRTAGQSAPASAKAYLTRLQNPQLSNFLLQYADADLATQALLGLSEPLKPKGASFIDPQKTSATADTSNLASDPAATSDTAELLTDWQETAPKTVLFNQGTATADTIKIAKVAGARQIIAASSDAVNSKTATAQLDSDTTALFARDTVIITAALIAANPADSIAAQAATAALYSDIAQHTETVLVADRGLAGSNLRSAVLLHTLHSLNFVEAAKVGTLTSVKTELQKQLDAAAATAFETQKIELENALKREKSVVKNAAALTHPEKLTDYQRSRLLKLFNSSNLRSDVASLTAFAETAAQFHARDTELIDGVRLLTPDNTQIFGQEAKLPVQIRNSLPFEISVFLQLVNTSAALVATASEFQDLQVAGGETITVLVPVTSRVSSGEASLIAHLQNSEGSHNISTETFTITIASNVETIGLTVLVTATVVLFVLGIRRSVKKKRSAAQKNT